MFLTTKKRYTLNFATPYLASLIAVTMINYLLFQKTEINVIAL